MLVLSRKPGEEVVIGSNIQITIVAVQGNRVRLGITAPQDVVVHRAELAERIEFESTLAVKDNQTMLNTLSR